MDGIEPRMSKNGKRLFTSEQKQAILKELENGVHFAELCRKYNISSNTLYHWKNKLEKDGKAGLGSEGDVVLRAKYQSAVKKIDELERVLGRKSLEIDILKKVFETKGIKLPEEK